MADLFLTAPALTGQNKITASAVRNGCRFKLYNVCVCNENISVHQSHGPIVFGLEVIS